MNVIRDHCLKAALRYGLLSAAAVCVVYGQATLINLGTQGRNVDFSTAPETRPVKTGTALPATCLPGDLFFMTGAPSGQNIYGCAAANTWTVEASVTGAFLGDPGANGVVIRTAANTTSAVTAPSGTIVGTTDTQTLSNKSIDASEITSGTLPTARMPAFSGDISSTAGTTSATLATVNASPGSYGDSSHTVQLTVDNKGRITSIFQVAVTGGGGGSVISTGTLASISSTCSPGTLYFATDQPAGQQIYTCSSTNTWTQIVNLGGSGALAFTNGSLDINTAVVPRLNGANNFTGLNTGRFVTPINSVAFSATPNFDLSLGDQSITLTSNITSSTTANIVAGQRVNFQVCQDATGSRTFAWPNSFRGSPAITSTAGQCTYAAFQSFDGTHEDFIGGNAH